MNKQYMEIYCNDELQDVTQSIRTGEELDGIQTFAASMTLPSGDLCHAHGYLSMASASG